MKKVFKLSLVMLLAFIVVLAGCVNNNAKNAANGETNAGTNGGTNAAKSDFKFGMVTDIGGVNDKSFNQSAWEALQALEKETGSSAQEYILSKTMNTAKELLTDPTKSISDVAYALGYQYPQYFSKAFKRVVGYSPNEYRTL